MSYAFYLKKIFFFFSWFHQQQKMKLFTIELGDLCAAGLHYTGTSLLVQEPLTGSEPVMESPTYRPGAMA